ncbi:MAG: hypothetical protein LBP89_01935 [Helicobacteraceae bacterium]|jgi:glycosyltransferase involved in cell wall biosynthesis|nr:hypothetical protein [Helicobacteraceae bacterium]
MNVLFAIYEKEYNDVVWHALNLATSLFNDGHDARIALCADSPIAKEVKEAKLPIETILSAKSGFLAYLHQKDTFKALASRFRVDLMVSYGQTPSGATALKKASFANAVCGIGEKFAWAKSAKKIIASSKAVKTDLITRYKVKSDRVFIIYGGLDGLSEDERAKSRAEIRAKLELNDQNILIGILGDVTETSGHKLLIEALTSDYNKNLKLIALVGDDSQIVPFKNLCRQYNISRVALVETLQKGDLALISALDIGVVASFEPSATARRAIELIAAGVSVVATSASADSELANAQNCFSEPYPNALLNAIIAHVANDKTADRASLRAAWNALIRPR